MLGLPRYPATRSLLQCLFIFLSMNINSSPCALKSSSAQIPADMPPEVPAALTPSLPVGFCSEAAQTQPQMLCASAVKTNLSQPIHPWHTGAVRCTGSSLPLLDWAEFKQRPFNDQKPTLRFWVLGGHQQETTPIWASALPWK